MEYKFEIGQGKLAWLCRVRSWIIIWRCSLKKRADLLIETYHVKTLVFDFSNTEFMDSSGIGVLIGRSRNLSFSEETLWQ